MFPVEFVNSVLTIKLITVNNYGPSIKYTKNLFQIFKVFIFVIC